MKAIDLRAGLGIKMSGKLCVVTGYEFRNPGNLRSFVNIKYRDVLSAKTLEQRFNPSDDIDVVEMDRRPMEFLYAEQDGGTFMDLENYEQISLSKALLGDALLYLIPNTQCVVMFSENLPIMVELPAAVELTITDTPPGIKGATATNRLKEAELETGLKTKVPEFITTGEKIKISTADGSYLSRAASEK